MFPSCDSTGMLHYVDATLDAEYYGTAIYVLLVPVEVNDLPNDKSSNNIDNLTSNLVSTVKIIVWCEKLVLRIAFDNRLPYPFVKKANRSWDQTNLVLNSIGKVKSVFFLSSMCMLPGSNGTKF